jgi:hypothetical protein
MSAFVLAAETLVRDLRAAKRRAEFQVIEGGASLDARCTKTGPCPCEAPCQWAQRALDVVRRGEWPVAALRLVDETPVA